MITEKDFKEYRFKLGFTRQDDFKKFLSAKDIEVSIDFAYLDKLNLRLEDIFNKINKIYYRPLEINYFLSKNLFERYEQLKQNNLLNKLNNQGRRKEEVYFSWMRGFLSCEFLKGAIAEIFTTNAEEIKNIGDDNIINLETFKRTPKADLEIKNTRIEVQSGFQGINDIKEHKVREAKRIYLERQIKTIVIHLDLFNGQVAFVEISNIEDNDVNWITRQQMEGQSVFNIDQNYFKWLLWENPPKINSILEVNL